MAGCSITLFKLDDELRPLLDVPTSSPFFGESERNYHSVNDGKRGFMPDPDTNEFSRAKLLSFRNVVKDYLIPAHHFVPNYFSRLEVD